MTRTKMARKKSSMARKRSKSTASAPNLVPSSTNTSDDVAVLVSKEYDNVEDFKKELNMFFEKELEIRNKAYENACQFVKQMFKDKLDSLPPEIRKKKFSSLAESGSQTDNADQNSDPNSSPPTQSRRGRQPTKKHAETLEFKKPKTPVSSRTSSRKRSASASSVPSEKFKTPLMTSRKLPPGHTITPKIYGDTPISIMRRPLTGEMAVSLTGSPLLVGSVAREDMPTVNVPLQDGRVFSIMPEVGGCPPDDLPEFDEQTKQYLRTLQEHLALLAPRSP